jgi:hypothetical protein
MPCISHNTTLLVRSRCIYTRSSALQCAYSCCCVNLCRWRRVLRQCGYSCRRRAPHCATSQYQMNATSS